MYTNSFKSQIESDIAEYQENFPNISKIHKDEWAFNSTDTREQRKTFGKKEAHKIICISASFPSSLSQNHLGMTLKPTDSGDSQTH